MKLQIENNSSSNFMGSQDLSSDVSSANGSAEVTEMLRRGIKAAQEGNRAEARNLLMQATELEPKNENAWLWLASISEYPEELLIFLSNVLSVNPKNERALEWEKSTKSLLSKTFVQRGIEASKESQSAFAKQCFLQAIVHDDKNEMAWLWLASISEAVEEKKSHLQKVLSINPENETALALLKSVKTEMARAALRKAQVAALSGETENAAKMLADALTHAPELEDAWMLKSFLTDSFGEKMNYFERVLEINPENEDAASCLTAMRSVLKMSEPKPDSGEVKDFEVAGVVAAEETESAMPEQSFGNVENDAEVSEETYYTTEETADFPTEESYDVSEVETVEVVEEAVVEMSAREAVEMPEFNVDSPDEEAEMNTAFSESEETLASEKVFDEIQHEVEMFDGGEEEILSVGEMPSYREVIEEAESFEEEQKAEADWQFEETAEADEQVFVSGETEEVFEEVDVFEEEVVFEESVQEDEVSLESYSSTADSLGENYLPVEQVEETIEEAAAEFEETAGAVETFEAPEPAEAEETAFSVEKPKAETLPCPFCSAENGHQVFVCGSCRAMLTLSDLEMLLAHQETDLIALRQKVEEMEIENSISRFDAPGLKNLGIGFINLKNYRKGFEYLQEAAQMNPNDVLLNSQVNSLAIRLSEIEEQKNNHDSMPKNKTILVVDDSATVRKLISGKLEKCGHEVVCAVDGMDALEKINESIPDLILLDITMPRMDGYQVCKLIRGNEATKDVPVVMISGKDGFFDKVRGRMAGTTGYITKPFGPETLMKTVEAYIE